MGNGSRVGSRQLRRQVQRAVSSRQSVLEAFYTLVKGAHKHRFAWRLKSCMICRAIVSLEEADHAGR